MSYTEAIIQRARARLEQARDAHDREEQARLEQIFAQYPRLKEIEKSLRRTMTQVMAATFRAGSDPTRAIEQIKRENLALQQERDWLLQSIDLEPGDLEASAFCPECGGSGYRGAVMCSCLKELCRQEQKKELTSLLGAGRETFDQFRTDVYPAQYDARLGTSPRELMAMTLADCQHYARTFRPGSESLLFIGATGLGKTLLSGCVAKAVADRGYSVIYDTAISVFTQFEQAKFGPQSQRDGADKYLQCDLLILDDLGTELTTQMTISSLYTLINSRMTAGLPTIISTNLPLSELEGRYSAPIASRILGLYRVYKFYGQDVRLHPGKSEK